MSTVNTIIGFKPGSLVMVTRDCFSTRRLAAGFHDNPYIKAGTYCIVTNRWSSRYFDCHVSNHGIVMLITDDIMIVTEADYQFRPPADCYITSDDRPGGLTKI